jgi:hypothetical protein
VLGLALAWIGAATLVPSWVVEVGAMRPTAGRQYQAFEDSQLRTRWTMAADGELSAPVVTWPGVTEIVVVAGSYSTTGASPRLLLFLDDRPLAAWDLAALPGRWARAARAVRVETGFAHSRLRLRVARLVDEPAWGRFQYAYVERVWLRWLAGAATSHAPDRRHPGATQDAGGMPGPTGRPGGAGWPGSGISGRPTDPTASIDSIAGDEGAAPGVIAGVPAPMTGPGAAGDPGAVPRPAPVGPEEARGEVADGGETGGGPAGGELAAAGTPGPRPGPGAWTGPTAGVDAVPGDDGPRRTTSNVSSPRRITTRSGLIASNRLSAIVSPTR